MTRISSERIASIEAKKHELAQAMARADVPPDEFVRLSKDYAAIEPVADAAREVRRLRAELEVLDGMPRLLAAPELALIIEWHPVLQEAAGHLADALPRALLARGFSLRAVSHTSTRMLQAADIPSLTTQLTRAGRPVELVATRQAGLPRG